VSVPGRAWDRFWFAPEPATNVSAARVIFAAHALWILLSRDLAALSGLPGEFWAGVPASARWRYLIFEGNPGLESVWQALAIGALVGAIAGVRPRACCFVSGLLLYHLAPFETIFWTPSPYERGFTISVLALLALSFCPAGEAWGLRLAQLFLCQVYLFSGYAKLFRAGPGWISADTLRAWLLVFSQQDQVAVFDRIGPWIADRPVLCLLLALFAVLFDLGFAVVLFSRRSRDWAIPLAIAGHAGILFSMNIAFLNVPQLLVFVDWAALLSRLRTAALRPR
jgi:hypothetical protein